MARHKPGGGTGSVRACSGALDPVLREQPRGPAGELHEFSLGLMANYEGGEEADDAAVAAMRQLDAAVDKLGKQLRGLEGTALKVIGVQPLAPAARHTAAFPPRPHALAGGQELLAGLEEAADGGLARCLEPVEVLVQLENSGEADPLRSPCSRRRTCVLCLICHVGLPVACGV